MTKYRNGKKKCPVPYELAKKTTNEDQQSSEPTSEQLPESECENCKSENDLLVQCEKCNLWLCCDCQSISPNMLNAIKQFQSLHWFCKSCEPSITKILNSVPENTNKSVEHRLQSMENHLAELTNYMNKLSSHWQATTTTHNQTPVMET